MTKNIEKLDNSINEHYINNKNDKIIVSFGGMAMKLGGIPRFEFLNYLDSNFKNECDVIFYVDRHQNWYHTGIDGISTNIQDTVLYLNNKLGKYRKIIFIGSSAGGYAAILFGSLCKNVTAVVAFCPQTFIPTKMQLPQEYQNRNFNLDNRYINIKHIINDTTIYNLYGDPLDQNILHHIEQCKNIDDKQNVHRYYINNLFITLKLYRKNGYLTKIFRKLL
jgi:hypothetical protein